MSLVVRRCEACDWRIVSSICTGGCIGFSCSISVVSPGHPRRYIEKGQVRLNYSRAYLPIDSLSFSQWFEQHSMDKSCSLWTTLLEETQRGTRTNRCKITPFTRVLCLSERNSPRPSVNKRSKFLHFIGEAHRSWICCSFDWLRHRYRKWFEIEQSGRSVSISFQPTVIP